MSNKPITLEDAEQMLSKKYHEMKHNNLKKPVNKLLDAFELKILLLIREALKPQE